MKRLSALLFTGLLVATLYASTAGSERLHRVHSKTQTSSTSASRSAPAAQKSGLVKTSLHRKGHLSKNVRSSRHTASAPTYQLHPDPERYQEIQKALADRGYFKGEVNGLWGDDSVDAMKRFQADQKLDETEGKIDARSLIGLGLGPRHDGSTASSLSSPAATSANAKPSGLQ